MAYNKHLKIGIPHCPHHKWAMVYKKFKLIIVSSLNHSFCRHDSSHWIVTVEWGKLHLHGHDHLEFNYGVPVWMRHLCYGSIQKFRKHHQNSLTKFLQGLAHQTLHCNNSHLQSFNFVGHFQWRSISLASLLYPAGQSNDRTYNLKVWK